MSVVEGVETVYPMKEDIGSPQSGGEYQEEEAQVQRSVECEKYGEKQLQQSLRQHVVPIRVTQATSLQRVLGEVEEGIDDQRKDHREQQYDCKNAVHNVGRVVALGPLVVGALFITVEHTNRQANEGTTQRLSQQDEYDVDRIS